MNPALKVKGWVVARIATLLVPVLSGLACADDDRDAAIKPADTLVASKDSGRAHAVNPVWQTRKLDAAPDRFRPGGWSDEVVLWGLVRGRVTRLDTQTGTVSTRPETAWSFHTAHGVVS